LGLVVRNGELPHLSLNRKALRLRSAHAGADGNLLRCELEGYAVAARAAGDGVSVEVAFAIENQFSDGLGSVGADERVQDLETPLVPGARSLYTMPHWQFGLPPAMVVP
jgi:hypothetical protein